MSVNETMALLHICKMIVTLRHVAEEVAILDLYGGAVENMIPGSNVSTPTFISKDLVEALSHNQSGILGHKATDMASINLTQQYPPTWIGDDKIGRAHV